MAQTKARKPLAGTTEKPQAEAVPFHEMTPEQVAEAREQMINDRLAQMKTRPGKYGDVLYAEYVHAGVVFRMEELTVGQQERVTNVLNEAGFGAEGFQDVVGSGVNAFAVTLSRAAATPAFLSVVLTADGEPLAPSFFDDFPGEAFLSLADEVLGDFFFLNRRLTERIALSFVASQPAAATEAGPIGTSSTPSATGT